MAGKLHGLHGSERGASVSLSLDVQGGTASHKVQWIKWYFLSPGATGPVQAVQGCGGGGRLQELLGKQGLEENQCEDDSELSAVFPVATPSETLQEIFAEIRDI